MRRSVWLLLLLTAATAGCSGGGADTPDPTVPTSAGTTPTSTTTVTADIGAIPDVIDEAYLNGVLAALDKVDTSAVSVIDRTKGVPPEAIAIFNSIYSDAWFMKPVDAWIDALEKDPALSSLKRPLGDRRTTVERLIAVSPQCVWMAVRRDYSQTDVQPRPSRTEYVALQPLDSSNDPEGRNPTAWMILADGFRSDAVEPGNPCPGG